MSSTGGARCSAERLVSGRVGRGVGYTVAGTVSRRGLRIRLRDRLGTGVACFRISRS